MTGPLRILMTGLVVLGVAGCQLDIQHPLAELPPAQELPETRGTYLDLGRSLLASNQPELAHDAFIRSIRVEGLTATALTGAGISVERQGLLRDARRYFERARALSPDSVLAHNNLGVVLYRLGAYHEARQAFQSAFALSSGTNTVAQHNLGLTDFALRREESNGIRIAENPVPVQRLGSGVYTLMAPKSEGDEG